MIDSKLMQKLQDYFCEANGLYLACIDKENGVVTKAYGLVESKDFLYELIDQDTYYSLVKKMESSDIETVIEEKLNVDYIKMCGISVRTENSDQVMWIVIGIIEENMPDGIELPEGTLSTTESRFYASIEFLETLTRQLIVSRQNETKACEAMQKTIQSDEELRKQLHRMESMNEVVTLLESENSFSGIVDRALEEACRTISIDGGCLIRQNSDGISLDVIGRYNDNIFEKLKREQLPFFTGKSYMISSDSMKPEPFVDFFERTGIRAAIFQPLEVNDKVLMYLCFYEKKDRIWSITDVKFLNDTKRVIQSVLSKRIVKNSLASSYTSLVAILENTGCGIYVADVDGKEVLYMNQRFKELFKNSIYENKINETIFGGSAYTNSFEEMYSPIENKWFDVHRTKIKWVDGREVRLCTTYEITEKKRYQQKIESQANNDFLTGLYNRMRCEQDLTKYINKARTSGIDGALIYIDLDDFKHINDGLGHPYGDVLLKSISHSLTKIDGIADMCYRMGGDEFIIIVPKAGREELNRIIDEISGVFKKPWFLKGENYYCTMSAGIVYFPTDGSNVDDVIRKADIALFEAKKKGKNCVIFYNGDDDSKSVRRLDMEKHMRDAAMNECDEFQVYFQPIVDVTGKENVCIGAEALVRWKSQTMGIVRPDEFIPLAEYLGLINPIGEHVLAEAAKYCKYWNDMGHPEYKVNVNLSVVQLLQNDIVKKIKAVIDDVRINPGNLCLEVTESLAINDMVRMKKILGDIKKLGVKVALDDFGTGYSSLNHIREMPIDIIKIDRCFIEHLGEDDFSNSFVKMVRELANTIGVTVCVEGVETKEQYMLIKAMGIENIQGYFFDRPMAIEEFEEKYL